VRRIIFVTGGAGFIDRLREAEGGKWRNIAKHPIGDFVTPEQCFEWLEKRWQDVRAVVHMGAISSTTEPDADKIVQTNFGLSRDLYRWCADRQRRFIYASSAATYGDGSQGFEDRDDLASVAALRPLNAYGWSKALFDQFAVRQAAREYRPPQWAGLRFFNVYGPNEEHKTSMKSVVAQIWPSVRDGGTVRLFKSHRNDVEDGGQLRDFVYVRDAAEVVAWLLENPGVNGIYNLGTGQARTFADLARATLRAAGREADEIDYIPMPPAIRDKYQYYTQAEMGRLRAAGYTAPFTPLEEGVADYVTRHLATSDPHA